MMKKPDINQLLVEEYMIHNDREDDEMYQLKEALRNALNPIERRIMITYMECGTYVATAKVFHVSTPTVTNYIKALKTKIIDYVFNNMK